LGVFGPRGFWFPGPAARVTRRRRDSRGFLPPPRAPLCLCCPSPGSPSVPPSEPSRGRLLSCTLAFTVPGGSCAGRSRAGSPIPLLPSLICLPLPLRCGPRRAGLPWRAQREGLPCTRQARRAEPGSPLRCTAAVTALVLRPGSPRGQGHPSTLGHGHSGEGQGHPSTLGHGHSGEGQGHPSTLGHGHSLERGRVTLLQSAGFALHTATSTCLAHGQGHPQTEARVTQGTGSPVDFCGQGHPRGRVTRPHSAGVTPRGRVTLRFAQPGSPIRPLAYGKSLLAGGVRVVFGQT